CRTSSSAAGGTGVSSTDISALPCSAGAPVWRWSAREVQESVECLPSQWSSLGLSSQYGSELLDRLLGGALVPFVLGLGVQPDEVPRRHSIARGLRAVIVVLAPGKELLAVVRGREESTAVHVPIPLQHPVGERLRLVEPSGLSGRVVQIEQTVD